MIYLLALLTGLSLGLLGGGGSILAVPILVYGAGLGPRDAIASSLVVVGISSLMGAAMRWRNVRVKAALHFAGWGMLGTLAGSRLAGFLSQGVQMTLFAMVMLTVAALMLRRHNPLEGDGRRRPVAVPALVVGLLTGLVGVGGGFLIVPALVLTTGLAMEQAVPTSLAVIALNCVAGLLGYLDQAHWQPLFLTGFTAVVLVGILVGGRLTPRIPHARLKKAFAVFLLVVGTYVLLHKH